MDDGSPPVSGLRWRERFLSGTRGRLIDLLRREPRTSGELAEALGISPNAVREHLATLEEDGLVEVRGVRREGVGKPPRVYETSPAAEQLFPKAYEAVLSGLLDVLEEGVGPEALRSLLEDVGKRAGQEASIPGDPLDRAERARVLLGELGAEVEITQADQGIWFRGHACPLDALVGGRPELCGMLASLLSEVTGMSVEERCRRGDPRRPRCAFVANGGREAGATEE